jgi:predicted nucleic acid-binding protein
VRLVVADTTPLNYLLLIKQADLLVKLFERIFIPQAVRDELTHPDAPDVVREWASNLPTWIELVTKSSATISDPMFERLDRGERAAIKIAVHMKADLVLMDDRDGASVARARGLAVTGTLGVLDLAARRGLVRLDEAFDQLRRTNFRCHPEVLELLLARHHRVSEAKIQYL